MKDEHNFDIQVYRISDPVKKFGLINSTRRTNGQLHKGSGNMLCESIEPSNHGANVVNVEAGHLYSDCYFNYKSMMYGKTDLVDNISTFVFGTNSGNHAVNVLGFDEDTEKFE
eukprot:2817314-Ditylum_brightwellii.AAC.1